MTDAVNRILEVTKKEEIVTAHLYEVLLGRNRILITEVQNFMFSVTLVKSNIIKPTTLDYTDLKTILDELITGIIINELMEVPIVEVLQNNMIIHFIIKYSRP